MIILHRQRLFFLLLCAIFATYLILAWQPIAFLLKNFVVDDAFYYFKPASNIAAGFGPTFDGEHITNGYHPLWMALAVGVYYIFPHNLVIPIHVILTISILFFFFSTIILHKIILLLTQSTSIANIFALLYAINPWNLSFHLNGLETPLVIFLFMVMAFLFLSLSQKKNFFLLGVVSGFLILSRIDYGLFPGGILLYFLVNKEYSWKNILSFAMPMGAIASPWFLYNYFYFGSLIPASGLAYTLINQTMFFYKPRSMLKIIAWSLHSFIGAAMFTFNTIGIPAYYSTRNIVKSFISVTVILSGFGACFIYIYKKHRDFFFSREITLWLVLFLPYSVLLMVHGAIRWSAREWYFSVFPVIVLLLIAIFLKSASAFRIQWRVLMGMAILLVGSYAYLFLTMYPQNLSQVEMYNVALWMRNNMPRDARIASFNSGIYGYFSDRFIMNSDGLINNAAYEAMRKNRLWEFFKNERIGYIIDYETVLTYRYKPFFGISEPIDHVEKIDISEIEKSQGYGGTSVGVYKIL